VVIGTLTALRTSFFVLQHRVERLSTSDSTRSRRRPLIASSVPLFLVAGGEKGEFSYLLLIDV
jgi:hypothetical protein